MKSVTFVNLPSIVIVDFFNFIQYFRFFFEEQRFNFPDVEVVICIDFANLFVEEGSEHTEDSFKLFRLIKAVAILCENYNLSLQIM